MRKNNRLTILVGTFKNDFQKLQLTIDSLLNQNFNSIKIVIIDDNGSENQFFRDKINVYVESLEDNRIVYIKNKVNIGVPFVYRKWIELVDTEYFMMLPEGDILLEDAIHKMVLFLDDFNEVPFVHGLEINENGIKGVQLFEKTGIVSSKLYFESKFLGGPYGWSQPSAIYRTEIFNVKNIKIVHDWYWDFYFHCTILAYSDKIGYINDYVAKRGNDGISFEEAVQDNYFRINTERIYLGLNFLNEFEFYLINKGYPVNYYRNHLSKKMLKEALLLKDYSKSFFALSLAITNYLKYFVVLVASVLLLVPRAYFNRY